MKASSRKRPKASATKAKKAVKKTKKAPATKTARKVAKKAVKKAVKKVVKKTVKKAVRKTAKRVVKAAKVVKKTVKKAAKPVRKAVASPPPAKKAKRAVKGALRKNQLGKYRKMLLEKRRALVGDMSGIEAETIGGGHVDNSGLSNMPTHPADLGTDNYEHEFSLGLLESERALLTEIDEALVRINDRTYGICVGTGEPIGKARLDARPWAKYCIDYARKIEQGLVKPNDNGEQENRFGD